MIYFTIDQWRLGALLAVHTDHGLRAILLGEKPEPLMDTVHQQFPEAKRAPKSHVVYNTISILLRDTEELKYPYQGPLDLRGTDFQKSVWQILQNIPCGKTMTYSAVAEKVGRPKAYRAVAQACGANLLALVIPCHRVVGKNGLGGYRYGLPLKERLLRDELERSSITSTVT